MIELIGFFTAFTIAVVSPGPNYLVMLNASRVGTRINCLQIALGIMIGEAIWAALALFGVAEIAERVPLVKASLALGGGLFLAYLGYGALMAGLRAMGKTVKADVEPLAEAEPSQQPNQIGKGLLLMMLNPKAAAFWLSMTTVLLSQGYSFSLRFGILVLAVIISFAWHGSLAWLVTTKPARRALQRLGPYLDMVLGLVLLSLAGYLLLSFWRLVT